MCSRLESKTDAILELFDENRRDAAMQSDVSIHTELERMRHEKEELEWQNHRLIERMAKLKFILKGFLNLYYRIKTYRYLSLIFSSY